MKLKINLILLTISLFILACDQAPEVSIDGVELSLDIQRFEKDLFSKTSDLSHEDVDALHQKYGAFYKLFVEGVISVGRAEDSSTTYYLNHFRNNTTVREVADETISYWTDMTDVMAILENGFKRYHVLFPEKTIPQVYTFLSAFSYTIVVDDSILGIGLDMYLGRDHEFYKRLGIPRYKVMNMDAAHIPTDCMNSWISTEFELESEESDLLSHMVYHGKILYALELLFPEVEDSVIIGYTTTQMDWVQNNEKEMYFHLANEDLFYSKEGKDVQNFIGEAPFTPGFPEGSPGKTGRWIGWQIVKNFMEKTGPLKLNDLFEDGDARKIFNQSKYKPI